MGAPVLHVVGNPHAEGFYLATGFVAVGRESTRSGDALLMYRTLESAHTPAPRRFG